MYFQKDLQHIVNRRGVTGRDSRLNWALGLMNDGDTIAENITHLSGRRFSLLI